MSTTISHTAVQLALRNRLLTVSGLPARAVENKDYTPVAGTAYVEEKLVPATQSMLGLDAASSAIWTGLYVVTLHGLSNTGLAVSTSADSVLAKFAPGLTLTATDGTVVRISKSPAPYRGEVMVMDGWAVCAIKIGYWILN